MIEHALFSASWLRFSRALRAGRGRVDLQVTVADRRLDRYLTLVGRFPSDVAGAVVGEGTALGDGHYVYPPGDLHVTVADCSSLLPPGDTFGAVEAVRARMAEALQGAQPLRLRLDGLNLFPTTVYVQAWDDAGTMWRLRRQVREAFGQRLSLRARLSFANVVRFTAPPSPAIVGAVKARRRTSFGTVQVEAVELALTDKYLSSAGTTVLSTFPLTGDGRHGRDGEKPASGEGHG